MNPTSIQIISNFWVPRYSERLPLGAVLPIIQLNCVVNEGPFCITDTGYGSVPALFRFDCFA